MGLLGARVHAWHGEVQGHPHKKHLGPKNLNRPAIQSIRGGSEVLLGNKQPLLGKSTDYIVSAKPTDAAFLRMVNGVILSLQLFND